MKTILFLLTLLFAIPSFSQINVGPVERVKLNTKTFDEADLDYLKSSETYFIYRDDDEENLDELQAALEDAWTYSSIQLIPYDEFKRGRWNGNYSFFTLGGYTRIKDSYSNTHIYLTLWMFSGREKKYFARIEIFPTFPTYQEVEALEGDRGVDYLYKNAEFRNWFPGYLKNSLQFVNDHLEKKEEHWLFKTDVYANLGTLKKDTLFIPDYLLIKFNKFTGDESKKHDIKDLADKYEFPIKVISTEELSSMILNRKTDFYYLSYIKSSTDKYINIFNGRTGEMLYSRYKGMSYNLKDKDFMKISKEVEKGS